MELKKTTVSFLNFLSKRLQSGFYELQASILSDYDYTIWNYFKSS